MDHRLPSTARFHHRGDYARVYHRGVRAHGRWCSVQLARRSKRAGRCARLGITVSTKIDKRAVRRHQLKRWVRECFRRELKQRLHRLDCSVIFRAAPPPDAHAELDAELHCLVDKALSKLDASGAPHPG